MQRHLANPDLAADSRWQLIDLLNSTTAVALDLSLHLDSRVEIRGRT